VGFALFMIHFVFVSPWLHGDSLKARGLGPAATAFVRTDNLGKAILRYGALSLGASALLIIGGLIHNPAMFEAVVWYSVAVKFIHYLFSATIQDALFFAFFLQRITGIVEGSANTRSSDLKRRALASGGGAFLFCIYHFPNPAIMAISLTFGGMMFWCYYRHPNLVAVVIAHAFTGTVMHRILQVPMRVGPFYKDPDGYIIRELFPIVGKLIGGLW
jgi:membrane protease YdiL (CAAX protease family)